MASKCLSNDQQNFTRMEVACVDEISLVFRDILESQIAPKDLYIKINLCFELTNGARKLRPEQKKVCFLSPPCVPDYSIFDVTLLYTLIRNLCHCLKPSQGWGKKPDNKDIQIGDDIERLRLFRNEQFGHASSSCISDNEFNTQWKELEIILKRVQAFVISKGQIANYEEKLACIKKFNFGYEDMEKFKTLVKGFLQLSKQTEGFPTVKIKGNNSILCGDNAFLEAEIGNYLEYTNLTVTWQKLKRNTKEELDINSEKFNGSTYLHLVIQRVLKEDEGEYQAVVHRELNGQRLDIPSNKLSLQVFGDQPRMEILQITSGIECITVHYNFPEDLKPRIEQVKWTKNGKVLIMNSTKYNGGGVNDKYLKILTPTKEDGGEYTYTVFNALGSVRRNIHLGVPTAQLPKDMKILVGSRVAIEPIIQSCPPVMEVVWQMSKDQKSENFKNIDITLPRYFESTLDLPKPSLVIPKVSYADRMYYRIQMTNGIGNSWSNATLFKVDGEIPSVFLKHETNFLERKVSLICEIVLAENSPNAGNVLWTKDKKPLDISGCGEKYSGGEISSPTLIINKVNPNDYGEYQCNVSNAVGTMLSCPVNLAPPSIEVCTHYLDNDEEGEKLVCRCKITSIPEATGVEWSIQQCPEDSFNIIDVHEPTYIGSTVALPFPVLIFHKQVSLQKFRIKVTNFIGDTTKVIQGTTHARRGSCLYSQGVGKKHPREEPSLDSREFDARMDFYRNGGLKILFANLSHDLAKLFPEDKLENLKSLLYDLVKKDTEKRIMEAKCMREILHILRQNNLFSPSDVLFVQYLLRKTECFDLFDKCLYFAKKCKALCFFEKQPENGFKQISFHIVGNVEDYSKENLSDIRNTIAFMVECYPECVSIEGIRPSESFLVIMALKKEYVNKLLERAQNILERLYDLNVDYLECDGVKIFRQVPMKVPVRETDAFGDVIKKLMVQTENCMKEAQHFYDPKGKGVSSPPSRKGNDQYNIWLQKDLLEAIVEASDTYLSRSLYTAREYLKIYNEGLIINSLVRATDSLNFICQKFHDLPESSENETASENDMKNLYESRKDDLKTYARDKTESEENPLLLKLKDIIIETNEKEPELKGIIFVRTPLLADSVTCWINESEQLRNIRATTYTLSAASKKASEKTKQRELLSMLEKEDFDVFVATSTTMDIQNFNLVVKYDFPGKIPQILVKDFTRSCHIYTLESTEKRKGMDILANPGTGHSNDPKRNDGQSLLRKISSDLGFKIDLSKTSFSEANEDLMTEVQDTAQPRESSLTDKYDTVGETTSGKVIQSDERFTNRKGVENETSQCMANDVLTKKTLKLRKYQLELSEKPLKGENCIIVSPTGSGKTYVAIRLIQDFLEKAEKVKKVVFIVDKNNLANQQSEKIKDYVRCRLKVISGDTQREEDFQEMKPLLPQYDVFVVTAQMLVNALTNQGVSIRDFSLLIFDECHHCHGSHPFKQIMNQYMDVKLEQTDEESQLPQVVGFTASVGVGKAKTIEKATEYLKQVMSHMDAYYLVTVRRNRNDLAKHVNSPEKFIKEVPVREKDEFGVCVKALMATTEKYLEDTGVGIVDKNAIQPPSTKGNEQYTQWLEDVLLKALAKLSKSEATRSLFTIRKYLEIYNNALVHHSYVRASDALNYTKNAIENLPKLSRNENEIERKIKSLFEEEYKKLTECALDQERTAENPLMLKLKEIILTTHAEEPNMRGIVFVRTRILADILASWINNSKELQHIKARKYTGSQAQSVEGGMTKHEQVNAIELFTSGEFRIIVATTIAEEGLDIRECNLVVRYDYAGNPISLVQARGRGRAENSRFYVLASAEKCVAEREWMNALKEPMMEEAMKKVQEQIDSNHDMFLDQQQEFQKVAKRERDAAKHNKGRRVVEIGQYCLRCLKCSAFLCTSSELRKILNAHHTCISEDIKNNIVGKKYSKAAFQGEDIEMGFGRIFCKECLMKLGTIALFKDVLFPILSITALKIEDDLERGDTLKKWKLVERYFKVPELTADDLENVAKFGKLIEF